MKRKITLGLSCIAALLFVLCLTSKLSRDTTPPTIYVPEMELTYVEGQDTSVLLGGVTAHDKQNGDLTAKIRIHDISIINNNTEAVVTYAVYDNSYNLCKASRIIKYMTKAEAAKQEQAANPDNNAGQVTQPDADVPEGYEDPELVSTGAPVIRLNTHEVKIPVGGTFTSTDYVEGVVDDKDDSDTLYRNMFLEGSYDVSKEGTYELTYYCVDSDNNASNLAKLKLIVGGSEQ